MQISSHLPSAPHYSPLTSVSGSNELAGPNFDTMLNQSDGQPDALREAFDDFVGQTFFQQMLGAMRKTVQKSEYFHGGRAEEVFQGQLDQVLSERLAESSAREFTDPLFTLFTLNRS